MFGNKVNINIVDALEFKYNKTYVNYIKNALKFIKIAKNTANT